jgi:putative transposase
VTSHPAEWTVQQFREALPGSHAYRFLIHDRDIIFSRELDKEISAMRMRVLRTPVRAPKANSVCERFGGTLRRECLDFLIPFNERHLKAVSKTWISHFNGARTHMSLGPGILAASRPPAPENHHRHRLPTGHAVRRAAVLGGLHQEYWLEKVAA